MTYRFAALSLALIISISSLTAQVDGGNDPNDNRPKTEITNDNNAVNIVDGNSSDAYKASLDGKMSLYIMGGNADNLDPQEVAKLLRVNLLKTAVNYRLLLLIRAQNLAF